MYKLTLGVLAAVHLTTAIKLGERSTAGHWEEAHDSDYAAFARGHHHHNISTGAFNARNSTNATQVVHYNPVYENVTEVYHDSGLHGLLDMFFDDDHHHEVEELHEIHDHADEEEHDHEEEEHELEHHHPDLSFEVDVNGKHLHVQLGNFTAEWH